MDGIVDLHVHSAPSLVDRHGPDPDVIDELRGNGVAQVVLKAHEGSTAERAALAGSAAVGGIVLNSPVGGANPDAVEVAARLGARVVWLPTASSVAHQGQPSGAAGHEVHDSFSFAPVPVCAEGELLPAWHDVLEVVARYDLVLASGHVPMDEALVVFRAAARLGASRFLVNHPLLRYLRWDRDAAEGLRALGARIEVGVLADQLAGNLEAGTGRLASEYPVDLLVFGSDLGFTGYPAFTDGYRAWTKAAADLLGPAALERVMCGNGRELLS